MRPTRRRAPRLAALLVLAIAGSIGVASADWRASGGGAGSANTGTTQTVTLSPATASSQLFPGGQTAVALTISNPNPGSVRLGSLALDTSGGTGGFTVDAGHSACGVSSLSFTTQINGAGWTVPGGGSLSVTLTNSLTMSGNAASVCQGATFTVFLRAGP